MSAGVDEEVLAGGVANAGSVVRVGDTVRRPRKPQSATVQHFLQHLVDQGLEGVVPSPRGFDEQGREVLTFLDGEILLPPERAWTAGDEALVELARLQRRLHAAAAGYQPAPGATWDDDLGHGYFPAGIEGTVVCHNDLCVENVVLRDGLPAAVIDFDYARPVDPLFDVAVAVRHWAPARDRRDLPDPAVDAPGRFRLFLDAHELDRRARARVVELAERFLARAHANVQRLAGDGHPGFLAMVEAGYLDQNVRSRAWLRAHADELTR